MPSCSFSPLFKAPFEPRNQLLPELYKPRHKDEPARKRERENHLYFSTQHFDYTTKTRKKTKPIFRLGKVARIRNPDRVPVAALNERIFYFCNVNSKHQPETLNK